MFLTPERVKSIFQKAQIYLYFLNKQKPDHHTINLNEKYLLKKNAYACSGTNNTYLSPQSTLDISSFFVMFSKKFLAVIFRSRYVFGTY